MMDSGPDSHTFPHSISAGRCGGCLSCRPRCAPCRGPARPLRGRGQCHQQGRGHTAVRCAPAGSALLEALLPAHLLQVGVEEVWRSFGAVGYVLPLALFPAHLLRVGTGNVRKYGAWCELKQTLHFLGSSGSTWPPLPSLHCNSPFYCRPYHKYPAPTRVHTHSNTSAPPCRTYLDSPGLRDTLPFDNWVQAQPELEHLLHHMELQ